ncbi:MAG: sigma-70 family RNA polymerase sigma factor [Bryobacterales bacterium]|nr:sigma-70 family RNA polymerase sigma factor [Bryobacterales bacterium]
MQDETYNQTAREFGAALERLARVYEADADKRRDLLQEIHVALWRSFAVFDGRCQLRTWVYRVAHNTAVTHVMRNQRQRAPLASLEEVETLANAAAADEDAETSTDRQFALERLYRLIHRLQPVDRQVMLGYLEGLDAAAIGEITGLSPPNVATRIHRLKAILARRFNQLSEGGRHGR